MPKASRCIYRLLNHCNGNEAPSLNLPKLCADGCCPPCGPCAAPSCLAWSSQTPTDRLVKRKNSHPAQQTVISEPHVSGTGRSKTSFAIGTCPPSFNSPSQRGKTWHATCPRRSFPLRESHGVAKGLRDL